MVKIGILTFHRAINYGAVLQSYALCKMLNDNGFQTEVIDYRSSGVENFYKPFYVRERKSLSGKIKKLIKSPILRKNLKVFSQFIEENIPLSKPCFDKDELNEVAKNYDILITGSDQVFNPDISTGDYSYLLDFAPNGVKKIAYAASFGKSSFDKDTESKISECLRKFDYISLREKSHIEVLERLCNKKADIFSDPSLLLGKEEWEKLAQKPNKIPAKYVLCYIMDNCEYAIDKARERAKATNSRVVVLNPTLKQLFVTCKDCTKITVASPNEFIWLVQNAEEIVTTSFHGVCFSLIFGKEVYIENYASLTKERIANLTNQFTIDSKVLPNESTTPLDFTKINETLKQCREYSISHFVDVLNNISKYIGGKNETY